MDPVQIIIIILIIIGLILIVMSMYLFKKDEKDREKVKFLVDESFTLINSSMEEFEKTSGEFNSCAELIFKEIDEKYQELLILYGFIEEQKIIKSDKEEEPKTKKKNDSFIYKNKNAKEIFKMYDNGTSITDIAKKLKIGVGEVQLLLNLRKA